MLEELFVIADAMAGVKPASDESKMLAGRKQEKDGGVGASEKNSSGVNSCFFFF